MYILCFDLKKNTFGNQELHFLNQICEIRNERCKTNLVTLKKCKSHLQYYIIDSSSNIKLQEINLNMPKEYNTKREAQKDCPCEAGRFLKLK